MLKHLCVAVVAGAVGFGGQQYATKGQVAALSQRAHDLEYRMSAEEEFSGKLSQTVARDQRFMACIAQYINAMNGKPHPDDGSCQYVGAKPPDADGG